MLWLAAPDQWDYWDEGDDDSSLLLSFVVVVVLLSVAGDNS